MSPPPNRPVSFSQIIVTGDSETDYFVLREENLASIIAKIPSDAKVSIVSVVGAFRTGKSFLLNFFLRYLRSQETDGTSNWMVNEGMFIFVETIHLLVSDSDKILCSTITHRRWVNRRKHERRRLEPGRAWARLCEECGEWDQRWQQYERSHRLGQAGAQEGGQLCVERRPGASDHRYVLFIHHCVFHMFFGSVAEHFFATHSWSIIMIPSFRRFQLCSHVIFSIAPALFTNRHLDVVGAIYPHHQGLWGREIGYFAHGHPGHVRQWDNHDAHRTDIWSVHPRQ